MKFTSKMKVKGRKADEIFCRHSQPIENNVFSNCVLIYMLGPERWWTMCG